MRGRFEFDISVSDQVHTSTSAVKIVIIYEAAVIAIVFNNPVEEVEDQEPDIKVVMEQNFPGWLFNQLSVTESDVGTQVKQTVKQTTMNFYFLDANTYDPINADIVQA